jgi:hypothetical protein
VDSYKENCYEPQYAKDAIGIRTTPADMANFFGNYMRFWTGSMLSTQIIGTNYGKIASLALTRPIPEINATLGWFIEPKTKFEGLNGDYVTYSKDGMSGLSGFSAFVSFSEYLGHAAIGEVAQAGVMVMVNRANGAPQAFSRSVLGYLLGGTLKTWNAANVAAARAEPIDDSDPVPSPG